MTIATWNVNSVKARLPNVLEWLGRAIDWGFCNYRYLEEYNPFLKPLHGNPRFQRLIDRAREKHEAFDA